MSDVMNVMDDVMILEVPVVECLDAYAQYRRFDTAYISALNSQIKV